MGCQGWLTLPQCQTEGGRRPWESRILHASLACQVVGSVFIWWGWAGEPRGQVYEEGKGQAPEHPGSCMQAEQVGGQGHGGEGGLPDTQGLLMSLSMSVSGLLLLCRWSVNSAHTGLHICRCLVSAGPAQMSHICLSPLPPPNSDSVRKPCCPFWGNDTGKCTVPAVLACTTMIYRLKVSLTRATGCNNPGLLWSAEAAVGCLME